MKANRKPANRSTIQVNQSAFSVTGSGQFALTRKMFSLPVLLVYLKF